MKYLLLAAAMAVSVLPGTAGAEFYVWRDAHGVKQVSNVPPRCIRGNVVLAGCLSRLSPLADPQRVSALNDKKYEALLRQQREQKAQADAERARQAAAAATANDTVDNAVREQAKKRRDLRRQLDAAEDEARMKFLHGHDVPGPLLDRIDRLRAELKALETPPGDS